MVKIQAERVTCRATIWQRGASWEILYHQGTIVQDDA